MRFQDDNETNYVEWPKYERKRLNTDDEIYLPRTIHKRKIYLPRSIPKIKVISTPNYS